MDNEIITFGDIEVGKRKNPISIHDVIIDRIVASCMVPFGKKGFK